MTSWLGRFKQRNVVRVTSIYAVIGYAVVQVANNLVPALNLPRWTLTLLALLFLAGFPLVIGLSYAFEYGGAGLRRSRPARTAPARLGWFDWALLGGVVAVFLFAGSQLLHSLRGQAGARAAAGVADSLQGLPADAPRSVAVLPFVNFGEDRDGEYFADGLTEELINGLAQLPELRVAGRTSTFYFKGRNEDLREIGRKLGVTHVVEGSVRRSGENLRITAQLIAVSDGFHLWSETFDRPATDAFAVQSQISGAVARALRIRLIDADKPANRQRDARAYQIELVARSRLRKQELVELQAARELFAELMRLEPDNPRAHTGFAEATILLAQNHLALEFDVAQQQSEQALATALRLAPELAETWRVKGLVARIRGIRSGDHQYDSLALQSYRRAVELDPHDSDALAMLATQLLTQGQTEEAIGLLQRALQIDPLSRLAQQMLGSALASQGRYAESQRQYESLIGLYPDFTNARISLAEQMLEQGRLDEAVRLLDDPQLIRADPLAGLLLANAYANLDLPAEVRRVLQGIREPAPAAAMARAALLLRERNWPEFRRHAEQVYASSRDPLWLSAQLMLAVVTSDRDALSRATADPSHPLRQVPPLVEQALPIDALLYAEALRRSGDRESADRIATELLRRNTTTSREFDPPKSRWVRIAAAASLGDSGRAVAELEDAERHGFRTLVDLDYFMRLEDYPFMAQVAKTPRFQAAIRRIEAENRRSRDRLQALTAVR